MMSANDTRSGAIVGSAILQSLLQTSERLDQNYTSNQLLSVLDELLYNAVGAIVLHTDWLDNYVSQVLCWYTDNTRKKIANGVEKSETFDYLVAFLMSSDPEYRLELIKQIQLDRGIWMRACRTFLAHCPEHPTVDHRRIFRVRKSGDLFVARRDVLYYYSMASQMKSMIMEKFWRLVGTKAISLKRKNPSLNLEDIIQNLAISLSSAVDRCSTDKGTLTTYVQNWFLSAQSRSKEEQYGVAYTVPDSARKEFFSGSRAPNIYVSLQELLTNGELDQSEELSGPDVLVEELESNERILRLAKHADPLGHGRYVLGLKEILT